MAEGENIGSLNFDVSVNIDTLAAQTAEEVSNQIKEGLKSGAEAAKEFENVIFEINDSFTQARDEVKKYYDVSLSSFDKLTDAQRYNQSEFLKLSEARGEVLSAEQKAWLDQYEERLQKFREEREAAKNSKQPDQSTPTAPAERSARSIIGNDYADILEEAEKALNSYDETTKQYYSSISQTETRLAEVKAAQKALNAEYSAGRLTTIEYKNSNASLVAQEDLLLGTIKALTEGQKEFENQLHEDAGAIPKLKEELKQLQDQYQALNEEELKSSQGKELAEKITAIKDELTNLKPENLTATMEEAISAVDRLRELKEQLSSMKVTDPGYQKLIEEATVLQNRINNVNRELKLGSSNTAGLRATTEALRGLIGGFTALQGVVGLFTDDNKELQKTLLTVTSAMSVLQGVQEFSAVLAKEGALNQFLQSTFMKNAAASAKEEAGAIEELMIKQELQNAATAIQEEVTGGAAVAAEGLAVAEEAQAVGAEIATVATEGLTAAMAANPATVLLVALTAIVAIIYAFASSSENATEEQIAMNDALAKANELLSKLADLYTETYKEATKNAENAITLAQAQGKSELQILELRKKAIDAKRLENIALLSSLGYNLDSNKEVEKGIGLKKAELESLQLEAQAIYYIKTLNGELSKQDEERLKLIESQITVVEALYNKLKSGYDGINEANARARELAAEKDKKLHDDAIKSGVAEAEARLTLVKKNSKAELDAQLDLIEKKRLADRDNPNLTPGELAAINATAKKAVEDAKRQYDILVLNNERSLLQARLSATEKGSAQEFSLRKQLIDKEAEIERRAYGVTVEQKAEIDANAKKNKEDVDREFRIKQLNDQKSLINAFLAVAKEGSAFELQLKQDQINKQLEIDLAAAGISPEHRKELEANAQKTINELVKKYAQDNSETSINTQISRIQQELALVEKSSKRELQLKKDLIDQKAALESVAAVRTIKNEELLAAKIKEINSKANVDKRKEDNAFADKQYQDKLKRIDAEIKSKIVEDNKVLGDPNSTAKQKFDAAIDIIRVKIEAFAQKQREALKVIASGTGDVQKAQDDYDAFRTIIQELNYELDNLSIKRQSEVFKSLSDDISKVAGALSSVGSAVSQTNEGLGDTLSTMGEIAEMAGSLVGAISQFASGNIIGGVVSTIKLIVGIFSLSAKARESERKAAEELQKFQTQILIGEIQTNVEYRERLRIQQQINKSKLDGLKAEADQLAKNRAQSLSDYTRIFALLQSEQFIAGQHTEQYGGFLGLGRKTRTVQDLASLAGKSFDDLQKLFNSNQLTDRAKELFLQLQKLKQEGADIDQQLLDIQQQASELFTGTTADSITDSIIDGFKNGLRSASDFADNFEDLMRGAIFNSLKYQTLEPALKSFYANFSDFTQSGGVLTADEIEKLRKTYGDIINSANAQFQNLQQITQLGFTGSGSGSNTLFGAIKGITAEQAQLLAGQFGGLRITAAEQLNISMQGLTVLQEIANNTSNLKTMRQLWERLELNGIKIK
jgi:hypothetical protein